MLHKILFFLLTGLSLHAQDLLKSLTSKEVADLNAGKLLYFANEVGQMPWPRATVFHYVEASPKEVVAVFSNYNAASTYIPNVVKSKVIKEIQPWEKEVYYELTVPILPNEVYVATNVLAYRDHGKQLEVSWTASQAKFFKTSVGNLRVEAYLSGSVLRYTNLVDPGSRIAVLLRSSAENQVRATVSAIVKRVEYLKNKRPGELAQELEVFEKVLAALPNDKKN